jgi:hypothetical protein
MNRFIFILSLFTSLSAVASPMQLNCVVSYNLGKVFETEVSLSEGEKNKTFGAFEQFEFFLSSNANNSVELQSYEMVGPSRSYATAKLSEKGSSVELSVWKREYILDVRCVRK